MNEARKRIAVVGGGAAGYFGAIACANALREAGVKSQVIVFEGSDKVLNKVRISGGGRCNVTNAQQDPRELVKFYPRGARELRGPLTRFGPRETAQWFTGRGVELKTEPDGRLFPVTDDSRTIVHCLKDAARAAGVRVRIGIRIKALTRDEDGRIGLSLSDDTTEHFAAVLLATGGSRPALKLALDAGHEIEPPVPSLFTFKISDDRLRGMQGVSFEKARLRLRAGSGKPLEETGAVLITHWGLSGPAVLRLSAWGARALFETKYRARLLVSFIPGENEESMLAFLHREKDAHPRRTVRKYPHPDAPRRYWENLCELAGIAPTQTWAEATKKQMQYLARELGAAEFEITGKGEFKEEFVTCGGVRLKEVDFRTMQSKLLPGLYFAGEVLDVDALTGGFNFQAAWTTSWIAGHAIAESFSQE